MTVRHTVAVQYAIVCSRFLFTYYLYLRTGGGCNKRKTKTNKPEKQTNKPKKTKKLTHTQSNKKKEEKTQKTTKKQKQKQNQQQPSFGHNN